MARTKKRRGTTGAFPESQTRNHCPNSTKNRPVPDDLPESLHRPFRELIKAAERFIEHGGHLFIDASWWTERDGVSCAVFSDRETALAAALLLGMDEQGQGAEVRA